MGENKNKPTLLIVEDNEGMIRAYQRSLGQHYKLIIANTLGLAEQEYENNKKKIALIVLDGEIREMNQPRGNLRIGYTFGFLEMIRSSFSGPIIATSGDPEVQRRLLDAGCTHAAEKGHLARFIKEISE